MFRDWSTLQLMLASHDHIYALEMPMLPEYYFFAAAAAGAVAACLMVCFSVILSKVHLAIRRERAAMPGEPSTEPELSVSNAGENMPL